MCNNPGTPQQFQAGGPVKTQTLQDEKAGKDPVYETIAGREFLVGTPGEFKPGIGDIAMGLARSEFDLPDQQVAKFTPDQVDAFGIVREGVGSFQPFLSQATDLTNAGVAALDYGRASTLGIGEQVPDIVASGRDTIGQSVTDARDATKQGIDGLSQTGGMYDPSAAQPFMNQFEDAAVQQALQDIARQGQIAGQGLRAQAVGSGAFGGSRQAIAEQELQRNVLGQQGRTAAEMRQAGFESAAKRSQAAYEDSMSRQQTAASGIGSLGIEGATAAGGLGLSGANLGLSGVSTGLGVEKQAADLGQGIANLGQQTIGLGQAEQQFTANDANSLLGIGGMGQQLDQAEMDAQRANEFQDVVQPFQNLAFASDVIQGLPSGQTTTQLQPGPSIGSQAIGLAVGGAAAYDALNPQQFQAGGLVKTQPREARDKLRDMGGIMSSSPQLANTVAKFNVGGPIQAMAPERVDLGGAMPLASAIHGPSGMMYGQMSLQQLSILANSGDRLAAEVLMMLQPPAGARIAPQSVPDVARALEEFYPGSGYADVMRGGPRMPTELATTTVTPAPLKEFQENFDFGQNLPPSETGGLGTRILEGVFGGAVQKSRDVATQGEQLRDLREGMTSGPGAGLDAITGDNLLPSMGAANTEVPTRGPDDGTRGGSPVAPEVTDVPVEPARDEASRKLLREDRKAAPPAKTPAPKLDFEDPNTFDTNYKTVMSRLEGVMGTGSKSSREDAMANLAMIGFAIAAGQSPDALTNIAQGALTGMKAIRAEKRDREEQEKALRMLGITTAMDMTAAADAAAATAARDDLAFERGLITEAEKSRLAAEREIAELQERARLGLGTGEGSVFNRSETPQEVYMKTLQTVRDAAPGTIGDIPEGMSQSVYAQRLAAQDALRHIEGLITMRILTDPDQIAAQQQLYQSRLDSTLTAAEIEQALTDGS